ncbi:MAG TPA: M23 family metallopeptidase, partial [Mycobacteriales bacterium]|nr:M23 family metallopeptidase [Mycobacteriales bacterium]
MLHARQGTPLRSRLLPAVLAGAVVAATGGLALLEPDGEDALVVRAASAEELAAAAAAREQSLAEVRASRAQRSAEAELAAREAARLAAEAEAARLAAEAEAARQAAEAEAARQAEEAEAARRAAEAEAKARAEREARAGATACPVPGATFTDTWGAPRSGGRSHQGTDLLAPLGTPVYAVVAGRIRTASSALGGISLYLDGVNGETYFYAHNSANVASTGQRVQAGDLIAKVG